MAALDNVKTGDDVLHDSGGFGDRSYTRTTVVRTTPTRVMIGGSRGELAFNRSGRLVGSDAFSRQYLQPWDDSLQHLVDKSEASRIHDWLRGTDFSKVSLAALREAARVLKGES